MIHSFNFGQFLELLDDCSLSECVRESTFHRSDLGLESLLDLVITDSEERVLNIDHLPPTGDITTAHCVLAWRFALGKSSSEDFRKSKCWSKGDYEGMIKQIEYIEHGIAYCFS
jgi:hypothetical protein